MFAPEVNEILQATPPKLIREMGMCGTATSIIYVQQHYYTSTRTRTRVSCSLVPGAACLLPGTRYIQAQNRLHNQRYGGLFRAEKLLVSRDYLITGVASSRVTPSSCDGGEAQFPPRTWIHCEAPPCVKSAVHAGSLTRVIKSYLLALGTTQISSKRT